MILPNVHRIYLLHNMFNACYFDRFYRRRNDILDRFFFGIKVSSQMITSSISSSFTDKILFLDSMDLLFDESPQKTSEPPVLSFRLVIFADLVLRVAYFTFWIEHDNLCLRFFIGFEFLNFVSWEVLMLHFENGLKDQW